MVPRSLLELTDPLSQHGYACSHVLRQVIVRDCLGQESAMLRSCSISTENSVAVRSRLVPLKVGPPCVSSGSICSRRSSTCCSRCQLCRSAVPPVSVAARRHRQRRTMAPARHPCGTVPRSPLLEDLPICVCIKWVWSPLPSSSGSLWLSSSPSARSASGHELLPQAFPASGLVVAPGRKPISPWAYCPLAAPVCKDC